MLPFVYICIDNNATLALVVGCYRWHGGDVVLAREVLDLTCDFGPPTFADNVIAAPLWQVVIKP